MALNLDDLIGSMQQVHAGDRGQGIEEMRENLRATLGQEALGPGLGQPNDIGGSRNMSSTSSGGNQRRKVRNTGGGGGGGAAAPQNSYRDETMLYQPEASTSSSTSATTRHQQGMNATMQIPGGHGQYPSTSPQYLDIQNGQYRNGHPNHNQAGPYGQSVGSTGSWNTSGSSVSGAGSSGFGWNAQAPANTPQPMSYEQGPYFIQRGHGSGGLDRVAESSASPPSHRDGVQGTNHSPRKLVNGFHPDVPPAQGMGQQW